MINVRFCQGPEYFRNQARARFEFCKRRVQVLFGSLRGRVRMGFLHIFFTFGFRFGSVLGKTWFLVNDVRPWP